MRTTLYERMGGYIGISAVVDDFVERLFRDPRVGGRLQGNPSEAKRNLRLLATDLLCAATGAPRPPHNRVLKVGPGGLGMTSGEWQWAREHLGAALARAGLDPGDRAAVLGLVAPLEEQGRPESPAGQVAVRRAVTPLVVRLAARSSLTRAGLFEAGAA